ncbi:putative quinol monooxygenase [Pseudonocardia sp.]|uniref:putative quinol monooxygenase n=1 Tax=Pseudonocardia sp. TaxID=60912 RepID=UPI00261309F6|nr:putative quinol monooxygenase [Pseudonocardia sp.]
MILINVKFPIRPEKIDEWLVLAEQYAKDVNAEEGCLFFEWSRSLLDPNEFVTIEGFRDSDAGGAHMSTGHVANFMGKAPDLVSAQPKIIYVDAAGVDGWGPMGEISPR